MIHPELCPIPSLPLGRGAMLCYVHHCTPVIDIEPSRTVWFSYVIAWMNLTGPIDTRYMKSLLAADHTSICQLIYVVVGSLGKKLKHKHLNPRMCPFQYPCNIGISFRIWVRVRDFYLALSIPSPHWRRHDI